MLKKRWLNLILAVVMVFTAVFFMVGCAPKTFTVTFNEGAEDAVLVNGKEVQNVTNSSQIEEPVYVRPGYNFVGWDRSISMIKESAVINAQWKKYDFQVVFQSNGGKTQDNQEEITLTVNSAYELMEKKPTFIKKGYELSWDKKLASITTSCTINAVWTPKTYNLEFVDENGSAFSNNTMQVAYNTIIDQISVTPPNVTGKRFAYWSEEPLGALSVDKGIVWKEDRNAKFYANYVDENDFIITYDLDGGERGERVYSYSADADENANIVFDAQKVGYVFEGWLIGDNPTPKLSKDISIKDFKVNGEYRDVTLKACWGNRPYVITYDTLGGVLTGENNKQVTYNQVIGALPTVQKSGYTFVGWYYDGKLIDENDLWQYPLDATLTAKYLAEFKVKFSLSTVVNVNGAIINCKVVNLGSIMQGSILTDVELALIEGQSLYTALGISKMPDVSPIEQAGKTEYEFGGYWKWLDEDGNEHIIDSTTVLDLSVLLGAKGGDTITLVPHCRKIWSPNA